MTEKEIRKISKGVSSFLEKHNLSQHKDDITQEVLLKYLSHPRKRKIKATTIDVLKEMFGQNRNGFDNAK